MSQPVLSFFDRTRFQLGMCLAICGVPLAMLLNFVYPIVSWSPIIMGTSVILLFNGLKSNANAKRSQIMITILLFQVLMVIYWFFDSAHEFKYLAFHLFVLAFYFVFRSNSKLDNLDYLPALFIYSGALSIIFAFLEYLGFFSFEYWYALGMEEAGERTLEVFTANIAAYTNLVTCLVLLSKNNKKSKNLLFLALCLVDMYVISYSAKRSYFVASVFAVSYIMYKAKTYKRYLPHTIIAVVLAIVVVPEIRDTFVTLLHSTISGFTDVFGGKDVAYDSHSSSSIRAYNLNRALNEYDNFSVLELLLGRGYLSFFIDNPLLESYLDMGILGFFFYSIIIIIYPLRRLQKNKVSNKYSTMALLLLLLHTFICVTNNNPYMYLPYAPAILLACYSNNNHA